MAYYKPSFDKNTKLRFLPHPNTLNTNINSYIFKNDTKNLNKGDFVKIKEKYNNLYNINITYRIIDFIISYNNILAKISENHIDDNKLLNIKYLEKDNNYYRKQKIKKLLNNK